MPPEQKVVSSNLTGRTNFIFSNQHLLLYRSIVLFQNQKRIKTVSNPYSHSNRRRRKNANDAGVETLGR
jgi:hypothetical protein